MDSIQELVSTYQLATSGQIDAYHTDLSHVSDSLIWIDDDINELKTHNNLGMLVKDNKGNIVDLAILGKSKQFLIGRKTQAGAGFFGQPDCQTAYLVSDFLTACDLSLMLNETKKPYCVLMAFSKLEKVVHKFSSTYNLVLPVFAHHVPEIPAQLKNIPNVQILSCIDVVIDTVEYHKNNDNAVKVVQDSVFYYDNGYFSLTEDAELIYSKFDPKTEQTSEVFLCQALHVDGMTRDSTGNNWGRLLRFKDPDGREKTWALPSSLLMQDPKEYLKVLAGMGLVIDLKPKSKQLLSAYIQHYPCTKRITCVDAVGWIGNKYVLPHHVFGNDLILQADIANHGYKSQGTLEDWQQNVSKLCIQHNRLAFSICVALSGAVLNHLGAESIGFHFVGASSMGKSLALKMASSVWGSRNFIRTWKATGNGMEGVASLHNDGFLALDEIGECDPRQVGNIVYMLGNGTGKTRMTKDANTRQAKTWRVAYLSTGEISVEEILKQTGQAIKAGQVVRLAHIEADAGSNLGMFDNIDGFNSGHELAEYLTSNMMKYHGTAGVAWLNYLTSNSDYITELTKYIESFIDIYAPRNLSNQAIRVCKNFAIVAGVGELATSAGITGWNDGDAMQATMECFDNWMKIYGHHNDLELVGLIERIMATIETHRYGRFIKLHDSGEDVFKHDVEFSKHPNLLGYTFRELFLFTNSAFAEVSKPIPPRTAFKMLKAVGLTECNHHNKYQKRIHGKKMSLYAIKASIFEYLDAPNGNVKNNDVEF